MKKEVQEQRLGKFLFQRNVFAFLCLLMSVSQIIVVSFLFVKNERIVVIPPSLEKEVWVDRKNVSESYLEQYGIYLAQLLLGKSPKSSAYQRQLLLREVSPDYYGALNQKLLEEEEFLKTQEASYQFFPILVKASPDTKQVHLIGERDTYIGTRKVSSQREGYILNFSYQNGRLYLLGISEWENFNE